MGYEIPTCQMQHDAADKKTFKYNSGFLYLGGTVLENVDNIKIINGRLRECHNKIT